MINVFLVKRSRIKFDVFGIIHTTLKKLKKFNHLFVILLVIKIEYKRLTYFITMFT